MSSNNYNTMEAERASSNSRIIYKLTAAMFFVIIAASIGVAVYYLVFKETDNNDIFKDIEPPTFNFQSRSNFSRSDSSKKSSNLESHRNFKLFNDKNCGIQKTDRKRVQHGEKTSPGEFPWVAALFGFNRSSNEVKYFCGGSLISAKIVTTAAHCVIQSTNLKL